MAGTDTDSPILVITPTEQATETITRKVTKSNLSNNRRESMIRRRMLAIINVRLRQAFPENSKEPFEGRSIILLGDFGIAAYKRIREVFKLDVILRQTGNSNEQKEFCDILLRMCDGESSLDDWKILSIRFKENLNQQERERFSDAVFLLTT
ncbi:hypothetical protein RhiirB3_525979 [Rhizophagus irregularis]|nr:hypothetical protein RhiirB3_525979 [Rhizophagus irregularis]